MIGDVRASLAEKKKIAIERKTELSAQRAIQPCSAETKRNANLTRNERIARLEEKVALETLEKEEGTVRPEEKKSSSFGINRCPASCDISVERHILDCRPQTSRIIYCPTDRTRPGGQLSQNISHL